MAETIDCPYCGGTAYVSDSGTSCSDPDCESYGG